MGAQRRPTRRDRLRRRSRKDRHGARLSCHHRRRAPHEGRGLRAPALRPPRGGDTVAAPLRRPLPSPPVGCRDPRDQARRAPPLTLTGRRGLGSLRLRPQRRLGDDLHRRSNKACRARWPGLRGAGQHHSNIGGALGAAVHWTIAMARTATVLRDDATRPPISRLMRSPATGYGRAVAPLPPWPWPERSWAAPPRGQWDRDRWDRDGWDRETPDHSRRTRRQASGPRTGARGDRRTPFGERRAGQSGRDQSRGMSRVRARRSHRRRRRARRP